MLAVAVCAGEQFVKVIVSSPRIGCCSALFQELSFWRGGG